MLFNFSKKFFLGTYLNKALSGVFLLNFFRIASKLLISIILIHMLDTSNYGLYIYVITLLNMITLFSSAGLPNLSAREVAICVSRERWGKLKNYIFQAHKLILINNATIILLAFIFLHLFLSDTLNKHTINIGMISMLLLPFLSLGLLRSGILRGLKNPVLSQLPEYCITPSVFILFLLLRFLLFKGSNLGVISTLLLQLTAIIIGFSVGIVLLVKKLPHEVFTSRIEFARLSVTLKSALPFLCLSGFSLINARIDILLLGFLRPSSEIGVYQVVTLFSQTLILPLIIYSSVASPLIADLYYKKSKAELQKIATFGTRITFTLTALGTVMLIFLGRFILAFIYKPVFAEKGYFPLIVLAVAQLANTALGDSETILNMTNHENITIRIMVMTIILNIILNFLFVPFFGISGSAIATAISIITGKLFLYYHVYHKININPYIAAGIKKYIKNRLFR